MRRVLIVALMMALFASDCCALGGARLRMVGQSCTLPVSGELGDNDNYLSNWSLTGGPCGVIFYEAEWSEYALDWSIKLYSDAERTRQIGSGIGTGTIAISGTVTGSVTAVSGESAYIQLLGTLTR